MAATDNTLAIKVERVSKTFNLPHERTTSIKSALIHLGKKKSMERQHVLKDISFEIERGDFFGIVGRNGSGKSTLLKLLAGIYTQDKGTIQVNGSLTPFIELGVGFNPELTGRENVFLNGALLGFNHREMEAMYHDIVEFAELERFMDQKLKNYSSGMQVRLAFSIAMRAETDILLIDEVLAVGDAAFQQKCFDVFSELKKKGVTIILVTHDMNAVLRFCDRAILIDNGSIISQGKPSMVADDYLELNYEHAEKPKTATAEAVPKDVPRITSVKLVNQAGTEAHKFDQKETIQVEINYTNPQQLPAHFGLQIFNDAGVYCFGTNTKYFGLQPTTQKKGKMTITLTPTLGPGTYHITAATMNDNIATVYHYRAKVVEFRMVKYTQLEGIAILEHNWQHSDK